VRAKGLSQPRTGMRCGDEGGVTKGVESRGDAGIGDTSKPGGRVGVQTQMRRGGSSSWRARRAPWLEGEAEAELSSSGEAAKLPSLDISSSGASPPLDFGDAGITDVGDDSGS